jgi:hypothetical protein
MTAVADVDVMFRLLAGMIVQPGFWSDLCGETFPSRRPRKDRMEFVDSGGGEAVREVTGLLAPVSIGSGAGLQEFRDDA